MPALAALDPDVARDLLTGAARPGRYCGSTLCHRRRPPQHPDPLLRRPLRRRLPGRHPRARPVRQSRRRAGPVTRPSETWDWSHIVSLTREEISSLAKMCSTCASTVRLEMNRRVAMSRLESPLATSSPISRSRLVGRVVTEAAGPGSPVAAVRAGGRAPGPAQARDRARLSAIARPDNAVRPWHRAAFIRRPRDDRGQVDRPAPVVARSRSAGAAEGLAGLLGRALVALLHDRDVAHPGGGAPPEPCRPPKQHGRPFGLTPPRGQPAEHLKAVRDPRLIAEIAHRRQRPAGSRRRNRRRYRGAGTAQTRRSC